MDRDERFVLEHSTLLEEYKAMKAEIVSNLDSARQITSLTLTAIGVLIATTSYIIQSRSIALFLIAPLFFYGLAWTQLRYIYLVFDMNAHLREVTIPRIHQIMAELSHKPESNFSKIMSWELLGKSVLRQRRGRLLKVLFLPIAGANYGIPLLAAMSSTCTFLLLTYQSSQTVSTIELVLLAIDAIALAYSIYWGFQAELRR